MTPFPSLHSHHFKPTSTATFQYNCVAWAAGETTRWWWPIVGLYYWPSGTPSDETIESFVAAFATLGFVTCESDDVEKGTEKVALYATAAGTPTHMARQLP